MLSRLTMPTEGTFLVYLKGLRGQFAKEYVARRDAFLPIKDEGWAVVSWDRGELLPTYLGENVYDGQESQFDLRGLEIVGWVPLPVTPAGK